MKYINNLSVAEIVDAVGLFGGVCVTDEVRRLRTHHLLVGLLLGLSDLRTAGKIKEIDAGVLMTHLDIKKVMGLAHEKISDEARLYLSNYLNTLPNFDVRVYGGFNASTIETHALVSLRLFHAFNFFKTLEDKDFEIFHPLWLGDNAALERLNIGVGLLDRSWLSQEFKSFCTERVSCGVFSDERYYTVTDFVLHAIKSSNQEVRRGIQYVVGVITQNHENSLGVSKELVDCMVKRG